jgi:hypothetical protein
MQGQKPCSAANAIHLEVIEPTSGFTGEQRRNTNENWTQVSQKPTLVERSVKSPDTLSLDRSPVKPPLLSSISCCSLDWNRCLAGALQYSLLRKEIR